GWVCRPRKLYAVDETRVFRIIERHRDHVHESAEGVLGSEIAARPATRAARVVAVDDQIAVRDPRHCDGVRTTWELYRCLQLGAHWVTDVEHVHALPASGYRRPEAGPGAGLPPVPRPEEDVLPDNDASLVAVALRVG